MPRKKNMIRPKPRYDGVFFEGMNYILEDDQKRPYMDTVSTIEKLAFLEKLEKILKDGEEGQEIIDDKNTNERIQDPDIKSSEM